MMNKIIGLAVLLLCMSGCVRDNDAIYYPVGDVDIERGGPALEVGEGDVLVVRSYNEEDYVLDTIAQYPNDPTLGKLTLSFIDPVTLLSSACFSEAFSFALFISMIFLPSIA